MQRLKGEGKLTPEQSTCFTAPRPKIEFYAINDDPYELHNLALDPTYAEVIKRFRTAHLSWKQQTGDKIPSLRTPDEFDRVTGTPTPARIRPRWPKAKMIKEGVIAP
jgi:hypothetical protein